MSTSLYKFQSDSPALLVLGILWLLVWLWTMWQALARTDLDPVTKLMWVLVVILVPIAGVFFYCFLAPDAPRRALGRDDVRVLPDEPIKCVKCQTVIPGDATVCPKCGWSYAHKAAE